MYFYIMLLIILIILDKSYVIIISKVLHSIKNTLNILFYLKISMY